MVPLPGVFLRGAARCWVSGSGQTWVSWEVPNKVSGSFVESGQEEGWSRKLWVLVTMGRSFPRAPLLPAKKEVLAEAPEKSSR